MCIFFGEGDLQMNGLMIKAIAGSFFFFFFSLPSSAAEQDGMWEGGRMVWARGIKKYKSHFDPLKIFLASLTAPAGGGLAFRWEHLLQMRLPDNLFPPFPSTFGYLGMRQRAGEERASWGHRAVLLPGSPGEHACVVKGWEGIKKQRNNQRNEKAGAWALQKQ